ncbi:MAG: hypothetical protein IT463_13205 [Planctomycetes bacterium]|nr:hypothetical protein [Planctomycetota bacterium]
MSRPLRRIACLLTLLLLAVPGSAEDAKPQLPKVPRGFDEGREALLAEAANNTVEPDDLLERLFEHADLRELAEFVALHLTGEEKGLLDRLLELKGGLSGADVAAVAGLLAAKEVRARAVVAALGKLVRQRDYTLQDTLAWLYARGWNFRVLQAAMNGERLDCIRLRAELRALAGKEKDEHKLFEAGLWEFNLADARGEKGGIYSGPQLVDWLLQLGWTKESFAHALDLKDAMELTAAQRTLFRWGDANLLWETLEQRTSESDLFKAALDHYRRQARGGNANPAVLELALRRLGCCDRWFRTGGAGVVGVYEGPMPVAGKESKAPVQLAAELQDADAEAFAAGLGEALTTHFAADGDRLTLVLYEDGSARAMLARPGRQTHTCGPATPLAGRNTATQLYEGRVSLKGRNGLLALVFGEGRVLSPGEVEFANVGQLARGALLRLDLDDGEVLTPMLLRRVSPLLAEK